MKKMILFTLMFLFSQSSLLKAQTQTAPAVAAPTLTGKEIMEQQSAQNKGYNNEKGVGKMIISDSSGKETIREFEYQQLEEHANQGIKSLIRISKPANLQGTSLLTNQNSDRDDDQWIYLPAIKKTNRLVGGAKKGRFIGSDFSYEDMAPKAINSFTYNLLRDEPCLDTTCHVIESISQGKKSIYSKAIVWVRSDNLQGTKMELYDEAGQLVKRAAFNDLRQINGKYWRPHQVIMENLEKKSSSKLELDSITINTGLTDADFTTNVLER